MKREEAMQAGKRLREFMEMKIKQKDDFRARDMDLSRPGALEEFDQLQKEAADASTALFNHCVKYKVNA